MFRIVWLLIFLLVANVNPAECAPPTQKPSEGFEQARVLKPGPQEGQSVHYKGWRESVLVGDVKAVISGGKDCPSSITVEYADKMEGDTAYSYENYFYPHELRVSADKRTLYVVSAGSSGFLLSGTRITEFDLVARKLIKQYWIRADGLSWR